MADAQTTFIALNKQQRDFALQQIAAEHKLTTAETQHYFTTLRNTGAAKNLTAAQAEQILSTVALANSKENVTRQDMILAAREVNVQLRMAGVTREARIQIMALLGLDNASINAGNGLLALKQAELAVEKQTLSMGQSIKLAMATNPLGFWLTVVSTAVSIIIPLITKLHKSSEEIIELGEEAASTMDELTSTFNEQVSTVNELGESYSKLAQGVNQITGENLTLSNEDYEEYLNISNELADVFPELVGYIDAQGNKILDLNGDYETINDTLKEHIELKRKELAEDARDNLPALVDAANEEIEAQQKTIRTTREWLSVRQDWLKAATVTGADGEEYLQTVFENNITAANNLKMLLDEVGVEWKNSWRGSTETLAFDTDEAKRKIQAYFAELEGEIRQAESKMPDAFESVNESLITAIAGDDTYQALISESKAIVQKLIRNTNWSQIQEELGRELTPDDMLKHIEEYIDLLYGHSAEFAFVFDVITQFNGGNTSVGEYKAYIEDFLSKLQEWGVGEDVVATIKLALNVEDVPDTNGVASRIAEQLNAEGKAIAREYYDALNQYRNIRDRESYIVGSVDLNHRPIVDNGDGSYHTLYSTTIGDEEHTYLVTPILPDGTILESTEDIWNYIDSNFNGSVMDSDIWLGTYEAGDAGVAQATKRAVALHKQQAAIYDEEYAAMLRLEEARKRLRRASGDEFINKDELEAWLNSMDNVEYQQYLKWLNTLSAKELESANSLEEHQAQFEEWASVIKEVTSFNLDFEVLDSLKEAISSLSEAYTEMKESGEVSYDSLSSIYKQFSGIDGVDIDTYISRIASIKGNVEELRGVLNELVTAKINNTYSTEELASAEADIIAAVLEEAGVLEADKRALELVERAKRSLSVVDALLAGKTELVAELLSEEGSTSEEARMALIDLAAQTITTGKTGLNLTQQIEALIALAKSAGIATSAIAGVWNTSKTIAVPVKGGKFATTMVGNVYGDISAAEGQLRELQDLIDNFTSSYKYDFDYGDSSGSSGSGGSSQTLAEKMKEELDAALAVYEHEIFILEKNRDASDFGNVSEVASETIAKYKKMQAAVHALADAYRAMGMEDTSEEIMELQKQWWEYEDAINSVKESVVSDLLEIANATSQTLDDIQNVLDTFQKAADEYAENGGFISVDTFQEILDLGPQYLQYLQDENGLLVINRENINKVIAAKTEQLALDNAMAYVERLRLALNSESVEELNELLYATSSASGATWDLVYSNLALLGLNGDQYKAALHNINAIRSLAENAMSGIGQTSGTLSEELETMKQGLDDILQYVMDMIEYQTEQQIEALEKQKEDYADIIEKQKESLELKKKEAEYSDEVADKIAELAKLQERIDLLALDDSRDAQAERAALLEEMAELQKELAELQADHAIEAQQESLDEMQEAYEFEKDAEIAALEESISSTEKLYQQAISYIKNNWETLYEELIAWNYSVGSTLESELVSAWNAALEAAQRYGSFVSAITGVASDQELMESGSGSSLGAFVQGGSYDIAAVEGIISRMWQNAQAWHTSDNPAALAEENQRLGAQLPALGVDAWYDPKTGTWYVGNERLFDKFSNYCHYHTGGVAGTDGTLKQNELLAVLEKGELILDERKQQSLYRFVDFAEILGKKIGKILNPADFSTMFRSVNSMLRNVSVPTPSGVTAAPSVQFGDVYIYGGNDETVAKHREVNRQFVNDVIKQLNIRK